VEQSIVFHLLKWSRCIINITPYSYCSI